MDPSPPPSRVIKSMRPATQHLSRLYRYVKKIPKKPGSKQISWEPAEKAMNFKDNYIYSMYHEDQKKASLE